MSLVSDPTIEPVNPRPSTECHPRHRSADFSYYSPSSLAAFASAGASPEVEWDDDVPEAESEDDVAAAELEDEVEWEEADADDEDDVPAADSEDDVPAAESEDEAEWEDGVPAAESEDEGGEADTGEPDSPLAWWPRPSNLACGDARKAELFRRPDAVRAARRLQESRLLREELRATESSRANPVLNPDENSLSSPPSSKSEEILPDKVAGQRGDTKHSTESASSQIVLVENGHGENVLPVPPKRIKYTIDKYAVQCGECRKWRLIPTKTRYDAIWEKSKYVPFLYEHVHGWKPGVSCDDPTDISLYDGFWAIDTKCISQTPLGWERTISIRSEGSTKFADVYYNKPPKGKKLRSLKGVELYLQANPDCAIGLDISQFSFTIPERLEDYIKNRNPQSKRRRQSKRRCQSKLLEPNEVLPLSYAPPIHEDLAHNCLLTLSEKTQDCM